MFLPLYPRKGDINVLEKHREKIENYGVTMEKMGMGPVASRVYVYLLYCAEPGAGFEDLVSYFVVSKSAVSNALKMLTSIGMVDSKTIGGQRKRYFFVKFTNTLNEKYMAAKFQIMCTMLEDIKNSRDTDDSFSKELDNAALFYKMMLVEIPIILERWRRTIELKEKEE